MIGAVVMPGHGVGIGQQLQVELFGDSLTVGQKSKRSAPPRFTERGIPMGSSMS